MVGDKVISYDSGDVQRSAKPRLGGITYIRERAMPLAVGLFLPLVLCFTHKDAQNNYRKDDL